MSTPYFTSPVSRRAFLGASLSLAAALAGCDSSSFTETSVAPPAPAPGPVGPTLISPIFPQREVRQASNGLLDTELHVRLATHVVGQQEITTRSYEGNLGGPTLRFQPGDQLRVKIINDLAPNPDQDTVYPDHNTPHHFNSTNLHTHGLHVSPAANSDNIFIEIVPGEVFQYDYAIPDNHPAGTYLYHPHKHGAATMQLLSGMSGALIIEGDIDKVPEIAAAKDIVFLINELNIEPATGMVPDFIPNVPPQGTYPLTQRVLLVNGHLKPTLILQPGEVARLRVLNSTLRATFNFEIEDHDLHLIALDGVTLPRMRTISAGLGEEMAPSNRADIMIKAGAPGFYEIRKKQSTQVTGPNNGGINDPEVIIATLVVQGPPVEMELPRGSLPVPADLPDIATSELTGSRTLTFSQPGGPNQNLGPPGPVGSITANYAGFAIDGKRFDPSRIDQSIALDSVEEWTLINTSNAGHPFHIHINPFQVIAVDGVPLPQPEWRDTINIPKTTAAGPGTVTIRSRFRDFKGLYVLHCHIIVHEDLGMMQTVEVY